MGERRNKRIEEVLKEELSKIIYENSDISRDILITLTDIEVSACLKEAKAWISVMPEARRKEVMGILRKRLPYFQSLLIKKVKMKWVPAIVFVDDTTEEEADRIEKIINEQNI